MTGIWNFYTINVLKVVFGMLMFLIITAFCFLQFSDCLMYTSRGMTASNQFKVHGQLPLYGMTIRESEAEWGVPHAFTLFGQRQSVVVTARLGVTISKQDISAIFLLFEC
ncbi:hypothetical protein XENORESO_019729 [Xenotaenia resolanae]|uniref:Uncharacterized protein n=1 Tax=Xenotaenia resolanae TaxID=208358 RepID=A0ABV0X974_9TELE